MSLQKAIAEPRSVAPKKVFVSYAHADENAQKFLLMALGQLEREGLILSWYDRKIVAGEDWNRVINSNLAVADVVLFLVSPSFLKSSYCRDVEVTLAIDRANNKEALVIPIILLACNWTSEPFARFQVLPKDRIPLTLPTGALDADQLQNVMEGLRLALLGLWKNEPSALHGATVTYHSSVESPSDVISSSPADLLLRPSPACEPVLLRGIWLEHRTRERFHFIVDRGGDPIESEAFRAEGQKVIDYFWERTTLTHGDIWVNFSPYESNRMLPEVLSGTRLGRDLLATDYQLKRFSASLLHPDTDTGRVYWKELYNRARAKWGTSQLPFKSYHKVWITADRAEVFVKERKAIFDNLTTKSTFINSLGKEMDVTFAVVVDRHLKPECHFDMDAWNHENDTKTLGIRPEASAEAANQMAAELFSELIIPIIERELNEGKHFAVARQLFNSIILGSWLLKTVATMPDIVPQLDNIIGSRKPTAHRARIFEMNEMVVSPLSRNHRVKAEPPNHVDHISSSDSGFLIPENLEFYQRYIQLFREGVYHVARVEQGDREGYYLTRVYFSGAVNFSNLVVVTSNEVAAASCRA